MKYGSKLLKTWHRFIVGELGQGYPQSAISQLTDLLGSWRVAFGGEWFLVRSNKTQEEIK
jgi:hypothetical protein